MSLVLDGSATLALCFEDGSTPAIGGVMLRVAAEGAPVPGIWRLEVGNGLRTGVRRGRLTQEQSVLVLAARRFLSNHEQACGFTSWVAVASIPIRKNLPATTGQRREYTGRKEWRWLGA